jgi:hypothetical protein
MATTLFESDTYDLSKVNDFVLCITHKPTGKTVDFEGFVAQGIINTITQQVNMGRDVSETLDRIGNSLLAKKEFK